MSHFEGLRIDDVENALGIRVTSVSGHERNASCPLPTHPGIDKNPSFFLNDEKAVFICFACGIGGSIRQLVEQVLNVTADEAESWLTEYSDVDIEEEDTPFIKRIKGHLARKQKPAKPRHEELPYFNFEQVQPLVWNETDWFEKRGISNEARLSLGLGYDPERTRYEYTGPAIVIPHLFDHECVGWQERWLDFEEGWDGPPKYTNTPKFPKQHTLYNWDSARLRNDPVIIVESAMTVGVLQSYGYPAMATFGGHPSQAQIRLLRQLWQGVKLAYDNDDVGRASTRALVDNLTGHISVEIVPAPDLEKGDLGDLRGRALKDQIARSEPVFRWRANN